MNFVELLDLFKSKGWHVSKDEVGDDFCELSADNLHFSVVPKLKRISAGQKLIAYCSISDTLFSSTVAKVYGKKESYASSEKFVGSYWHR